MQMNANNFIPVSKINTANEDLKAAVGKATRTAYDKRLHAMFSEGAEHGEALRQQAAEAKRRALLKLPALLEQAEANMTANGILVRWAATAAEAQQLVMAIANEHAVKSVIKAKSMVSEELHINQVLEEAGIQVIETDLGEYIIQLAHEPPSHIIAPVIHKSKDDIRDLFIAKLGMPYTDDAQEMTRFARRTLRDAFLSSDMGISGANFIIAETGTLGLVSNEGNIRLTTSLPKVHVALVGIEKLVETVEDYVTLTQVLPRSGTGQQMSVYTHMINGPKRADDADGPEHVYVIFVDNGRSEIYTSQYAEVLSCIRCGACLNTCPVYRSTGGHTYGSVYSGPIGAVLTPLLNGLSNAKPLPHASSLCGSCKQVCPVDINLPKFLLDLRHDLVQAGERDMMISAGIKGWELAVRSPAIFHLAGKSAQVGQKIVGDQLPQPLGNWTEFREFPDFAPKPFRQLWQERQERMEGKR
ncbi:MAG: LutB/LldF family L-lactate oxidation iron-sulfur protein [Anaerolineales bacterium]